jgi:manganese/zinc/iron transport system substrate-binding protein
MKKLILFISALFLLTQCGQPAKKSDRISIVCTTSMVADAVKNLMPKSVEVISLMGPGVDPHLYKATQGDLERLQEADVVVYSGLHLEGKMGDVLEKLARIKTVINLSDGVPREQLLHPPGNVEGHDPHIWFDLTLWAKGVAHVKTELAKKYPSWQEDLDANYFAFEQSLLATHNWAITKMDSIPPQHRTLVTAHDAFSYFGRAYHLNVLGLQGISTVSEFGLKDISELVNTIVAEKIPAVFVESSVPKKSIEAVIEGCRSKGHHVVLGGQLYSDALGEEGSATESLNGAFRANVNTIFNGLAKNKSKNNDE